MAASVCHDFRRRVEKAILKMLLNGDETAHRLGLPVPGFLTMITYQYRCEANGETLEVRHRMSQKLSNWGELCAMLERDPGTTPPETPVERVISGGLLGTVTNGTPRTSKQPLLPMAGCCGNPASCQRH